MICGALQDHPEGGRFQEVYRSDVLVHHPKGFQRNALTHIYFELKSGEVSRLHKVSSDEIWNLYEGEGLELILWNDNSNALEIVQLSASQRNYCHVVPAGIWQGARPLGPCVLVGCSVAPGFDFDDFELIAPNSQEALRFCSHHSEHEDLIHP